MKKLFFSAGDLSGDFHCSLLIHELLQRHPDWQIFALGGAQMKAAGAQIIGDTSELGVIGFTSALATLPRTLKLRSLALHFLWKSKPDAAILCDWGGFNTRILPDLNRLNIPVCYYFPPRSWQKRGDGGLQIAPHCARIATPFQWSAQRLNEAGGKATWVGHPILETLGDSTKNEVRRKEVRAELGVAPHQKLIALLPGSRALERRIIAPHVAGAVRILKQKFDASFFVAATSGTTSKLQKIFGADAQIVENRTFDLLRAADAAIVKSGTSTLEAAALDCPQVVVYDVPALIRAQVRLTRLQKKVPFVAMPNIIVEREIAPELLGDDCRAPKIAAALSKLLESEQVRAQMRQDYALVRAALGEGLPYTATHRTADLIELLAEKR
ncbi:lipid-A-disaccharide synthase [Abditibacterium utsteinense]|uniref:Lipid-A-disaccharide synthase n=1 Tax=Abditibacterium utsteinense TaxID=1960156 RepID=A0A2S8SX24_9BACT|nr:hypothetical protein [Abditibacterium utsteinense]PQV65352.1 lipid-A-disaccharide synthase [Abditibacterium utsteinense]